MKKSLILTGALVAAGIAPGAALGHLGALIRESLGAPHLMIAERAHIWTMAPALPATEV